MPTSLTHFLTNVAMDPKTSRAYHHDPAAAINQYGLTATEKAALLSKNPATIRDAILAEKGIGAHGAGVAAAGDTEVVLVIVV